MKRHIILFFLALAPVAYAQQVQQMEILEYHDQQENVNDTTIYEIPDQMPEFPGGTNELIYFLKKTSNTP